MDLCPPDTLILCVNYGDFLINIGEQSQKIELIQEGVDLIKSKSLSDDETKEVQVAYHYNLGNGYTCLESGLITEI